MTGLSMTEPTTTIVPAAEADIASEVRPAATAAAPETATTAMPDITVEAWRDHGSRLLPGSSLGPVVLSAPLSVSVPALYESGGRCVRLCDPVRLCTDADARDVRALMVVRELTGLGAAVRWTASCDDGCAGTRTLFHLFPPAAIAGAPPQVTRRWQEQYLPCKCVYRRGPGFVEIRDRRQGSLGGRRVPAVRGTGVHGHRPVHRPAGRHRRCGDPGR
ncbi:DUF5825 family protein [Streptomyces dangxiongensis]|uniref:DUF5825 family protein n=1 Tax=Streptomyces dangxiongensis TaxID=1442032 RepID=UPI001F09F9B6|nr:DUF5825 family protein [Streptomyces dangxiongensis]